MYLQFFANISSVCNHRMNRQKKLFRYFLICHSLHHTDDDFLFPLAKRILIIRLFFFRNHIQ